MTGIIYTVWSPDGRRVAVTDSVSSIFILDLERPLADRLIETLPFAEPRPVSFELEDWSPDGTRFAGVGRGNDGVIRLFNYILASRTFERKSARVAWARLLTDGRRFVAAYGNRLLLVDGVSSVTSALLPPDAFPLHSNLMPAISRDDRHLAFIEQSTDGDIWAMTLP